MTSLELLKKANNNKPYLNFKDLKVGEYIVSNFRFVKSKQYGMCICCDLGSGKYIYLPKRFAEVIKTQEELDGLNQAPLIMVYSGRDENKNNK